MKSPKSRKSSENTPGSQPGNITGLIKAKALSLGFSRCGIARAERLDKEAVYLNQWLLKGHNAGMNYMANNFEKRVDPRLLMDGCKSVISVILNYYTTATINDQQAPIISKYAYGRDYHNVVRKKLRVLLEYIRELYPGSTGQIYTDTAPLLERAWAARSGLGWIGRNSNLISPDYGSFVFIGVILTDAEHEYDLPLRDYCGTCTRCIDACPTGAITGTRTINANKCISYLTIENKGEIPPEFKGLFKNRVFGCDICQDVCPWNNRAVQHSEKDLDPLPGLLQMKREDWHALDEEKFNLIFKESPVKRAKFRGMQRNLDFLNL